MRTTAYMLFQQFTRNLNKNLAGLSKAQEQLSTGKKLTKPSDDVIAARGAMSYKLSINANEQYKRNVNEGMGMLGFTENILNSSQFILTRARELAVSMSSDNSTSEERELTSYEVQNLYDQLLNLGNSKLKNKYVFSGFATGTQSFNSSGEYQGDSNDLEVYINEGITAKINTTGDDAFVDSTKVMTEDLSSETLSGTLSITTGSSNAVVIPGSSYAFSGASPEEIRDAINGPMTGFYTNDSSTVGTGSLTFKVGTSDAQTIEVSTDESNTTVSTLVNYINTNVTGIEAAIAYETTEAPGSRARIYFRPATAGETFTIEVSDDDGNDSDTSGLSALLHTDLQSNMTEKALGIEAYVMNGVQGKRLLFAPTTPGTSFTIAADDDDGNDTDASGLSLLINSNMTDPVTFFTIIDNLRYSLANNDQYGVRGSIELIDGAVNNLVDITADVGARLKYMEDQDYMLENFNLSYHESKSVLEDADIASVALEVTKVQSALEALRISSMKSLTQSLIQFLS